MRLLLSALLQIYRESHGDAIVAEGVAKAKREIATNLLRAGSTVTFVVSTTGLSIEDVQLLQKTSMPRQPSKIDRPWVRCGFRDDRALQMSAGIFRIVVKWGVLRQRD